MLTRTLTHYSSHESNVPSLFNAVHLLHHLFKRMNAIVDQEAKQIWAVSNEISSRWLSLRQSWKFKDGTFTSSTVEIAAAISDLSIPNFEEDDMTFSGSIVCETESNCGILRGWWILMDILWYTQSLVSESPESDNAVEFVWTRGCLSRTNHIEDTPKPLQLIS